MENSNNKLVMHRRQLIKERYNLFAYMPILASNSGIREIAIDNGKLL